MSIKKTTTSPYHPNTQVDSNTLDWELYMAPMAFTYNTSFHRTIKTSQFTLTYGMEPRTIEFNARTQYEEDHSTELYQRMQHSHEQKRQLTETPRTMIKRLIQDNFMKENGSYWKSKILKVKTESWQKFTRAHTSL
jgi:hypothetical protein